MVQAVCNFPAVGVVMGFKQAALYCRVMGHIIKLWLVIKEKFMRMQWLYIRLFTITVLCVLCEWNNWLKVTNTQ